MHQQVKVLHPSCRSRDTFLKIISSFKNQRKLKISQINNIKKKMPPTTTSEKESKANIKKTRVRNRLSNIMTNKTINIKKGIKTDNQLKIILNSFLINKTCSKWTSLSYNQYFSRHSHTMDPICFKLVEQPRKKLKIRILVCLLF